MTATITVQGGLTAAPEMRYSQAGVPIASGTVASAVRYVDRQSNEWRDGKKLFVRWSAFKDLAENIAASMLDKGAQVTVTGKLHTREYEDREGNKRSSMELEVTDFAVSLKRATAQVARTERQAGQGGPQSPSAGAGDTWPIQAPQSSAQGVSGYGDASPF